MPSYHRGVGGSKLGSRAGLNFPKKRADRNLYRLCYSQQSLNRNDLLASLDLAEGQLAVVIRSGRFQAERGHVGVRYMNILRSRIVEL